MDIISILAGFGGGVLGAALGALPAFILTGVLAIAGGVLTLGGNPDFAIGGVAFSSFLGPHVAFAGGVAAAAYAGNKKKSIASGADIVTSLFGLNDYMVLLVGGVFGLFGAFMIQIVDMATKAIGITTDNPGCVVVISAIIVRFVFGSSGLTGKYEGKEPRAWFPTGADLMQTLTLGLGVGVLVSCIGQGLINNMTAAGLSADAISANMGIYAVVCFGISATSLIFAQTGFAIPTTHYITLPAATAFVLSGNIIVGIVTAVIVALVGDVAGRTFNSYNDTHIDPPACTIFTSIIIINLIFG